MEMQDKLDEIKSKYYTVENSLVRYKLENANHKSEIEVSNKSTQDLKDQIRTLKSSQGNAALIS